jgi:hypothetical protein
MSVRSTTAVRIATPVRVTILRCAAMVLGLVALHALLVEIAARTDLVERLLAPAGAGFALLLGVALLVLRVCLLFVVPGAVLLRVIEAIVRARRPSC